MKTILAPVDFSAVSDAVVVEAAALARAHQGRVVLLNVVQPPAPVAEYAPLVADIAEITAAGEKNAARHLEKIEAKLAAAFVTAESVQLVGVPVPLIVEQAEKLAADYIVMGSHGHTALYDLLVGSTTHGVLLRAKCPVVIVPAVKPPPSKPKQSRKPRHALV
jgi:nucleotide-binding universal stress UspA family protein